MEKDRLQFPDLSKKEIIETPEFEREEREIPLKQRIILMMVWDGMIVFLGLLMYYLPSYNTTFLSYFLFPLGIMSGFLFLFYKRSKVRVHVQ